MHVTFHIGRLVEIYVDGNAQNTGNARGEAVDQSDRGRDQRGTEGVDVGLVVPQSNTLV